MIPMKSTEFYRRISCNEYDKLSEQESLNLTYPEQESLISLFSEKFKVEESLDHHKYVDNEVIIGFNRVDVDVSCWINIRLVRLLPKTKKYMSGRRVNEVRHEISINKLEDEWFLVKGVWPDTKQPEEVKCDQMGGLIRYFRDRFNIS